MGNVRKMVENRIIEQQRSDKNYRTTQKIKRKIRYIFFTPSEENRIMEQQGTVNNRTFILLNFCSIIFATATTIFSAGLGMEAVFVGEQSDWGQGLERLCLYL